MPDEVVTEASIASNNQPAKGAQESPAVPSAMEGIHVSARSLPNEPAPNEGDASTKDAEAVSDTDGTGGIAVISKTARSGSNDASGDGDQDVEMVPQEAKEHGVFLTNLSYKVTDEELKEFVFQESGHSASKVAIKRGPRGNSKGCAVVLFAEEASAAGAGLALAGKALHGRALQVNSLREKGERLDRSGKLDAADSAEAMLRGIYIGKIPPHCCTESGLLSGSTDFAVALRTCGPLETVQVARNLTSAIVQFRSPDAVDRALALNDQAFVWPPASPDAVELTRAVIVERVRNKYTSNDKSGAKRPAHGRPKIQKERKDRGGFAGRRDAGPDKPRVRIGATSRVQNTSADTTEKAAEDAGGMKTNAYFASLFKKP